MYYFEYDKNNFLIKYKEKYHNTKLKKNDFICEVYVYENKIIKFEENRKFKNIIKYIEPIKLVHRFEAGESWLNIQKKTFFNYYVNDKTEEGENIQRNYPSFYVENKKENDLISDFNDYPTVLQQINLENDIIYNLKFKLKKTLINNWVNLMAF